MTLLKMEVISLKCSKDLKLSVRSRETLVGPLIAINSYTKKQALKMNLAIKHIKLITKLNGS